MILESISRYLQLGGLFNPELMDHAKVRDMIIACRDRIEALEAERDKQREHIRAQAEDIMKLGHLVYDDADPPVTWKMRALTAEADKARLSEARRLVDGIDEERRGALDLCVERNKEIARLSAKLAEARAANERDRTEVCMAVNSLSDAFARRDWLMRGGRGSYEWDDDRFRDEFRDAMAEFEPHIDRLRKIGADRTNCPETQAEVRAARAALSGSGSGWREPNEGHVYSASDLARLLEGRDAFIVAKGLWEEFTAMLAASPAAPQQGGE